MLDEETYAGLHPSQTLKIFGHYEAQDTLLNAFNSDRLHHAWLLCGEKGLGKATLAYIFARFLVTQKQDDGGLFGEALPADKPSTLLLDAENPILSRLLAGGHGNIRVVERRYDEKKKKIPEEIGVDQIRELIGFFNKTAAEGGWRVVIIDSVDELTTNASNALLKMLEEPPEKSILLLISHAPGRLLPTILSRCQKLTLLKLSAQDTLNLLQERFPELDPQKAEAIAKMADGSPGRAIDYAACDGLETYGEMVELLAQIPKLKISKLNKFATQLGENKGEKKFRIFCEHFPFWLGRVARSFAVQEPFIGVLEDETNVATNLYKTIGIEALIELSESADRHIRETNGLNLDKKQMVIALFEEVKSTFAKRALSL